MWSMSWTHGLYMNLGFTCTEVTGLSGASRRCHSFHAYVQLYKVYGGFQRGQQSCAYPVHMPVAVWWELHCLPALRRSGKSSNSTLVSGLITKVIYTFYI